MIQITYTIRDRIRDLSVSIKRNGPLRVAHMGLLSLYNQISPHVSDSDTFYFDGSTYNYFVHRYNRTELNERAVEITISKRFYDEQYGKRVLEVGNVLKHYFPQLNHDVLDKYEKATGVLNGDIVDFKPKEKYDTVISISTMEHVGFDENDGDSKKFGKAIKLIGKNVLKSEGNLFLTLPLGYNPAVDQFMAAGLLGKQRYLKRINYRNEWIETGYDEVKNIKYAAKFKNANAIAICTISRDEISRIPKMQYEVNM